MKKYEDVVLDINGNAIDGATVTVQNYPSGSAATVYPANSLAGGVSSVTTDSDGRFSFFAKDGRYNLVISKSGIVTETQTNVLVQDVTAVLPTVLGFGAVGDGSTDDAAPIQAMLDALPSTGGVVYLPPGYNFKIGSALSITKSGTKLIGAGPTASKVTCSTAATAGITIATGLNNVEVSGFTLTRSATATSGGDGIKCSAVTIGQALIQNMVVEKHYDGLSLGPTDASTVRDVIVQQCLNRGVYQTNLSSDGACQWTFSNVTSQKNASHGFLFLAVTGPGSISLGEYVNCKTYANSGRGMIFLGGSGFPIHGVRVLGGFFGQDGDSEIYLDTYGSLHRITGAFLELAGTAATGPTLSTAASNLGSGIEVTGNNTFVNISGVYSFGNSKDGIYLAGTAHQLANVTCTDNGAAGTATRRNGINHAGGRMVVNGGFCGNTGAGTNQVNGILVADGNNASISGVDLNGNATATYSVTANPTYITLLGCLPNTINVGLSPAGQVLVGGGTTWQAAGTINMAGGSYKAGVAYVNP